MIYNDYDWNATIMCPEDMEVTLDFPDPGTYTAATTIDTIINYLIGICVGAVVLCLVLIVLLALPGAVSTTFGSPKVFMSVGSFLKSAPGAAYSAAGKVPAALAEAPAAAKRAAAAAGAATAAAVTSAGSSVRNLGGSSKAELAVPLEAASADGAAAAIDGKLAAGAGLQAAAAAAQPGMIDLSQAPITSQETPYFVYAVMAFALYIAGMVLTALGTHQFVENSAAAYAAWLAGSNSVMTAIEWLVIGGLILIGLCDLLALFVVLCVHRPRLSLGKLQFRNYMYSSWAHDRAYKIHIVTTGLMVLVISVAAILFGLGLIVVIIQLAVRLACSSIADVNINGIETSNVCITVPSVSEEPICGWQVMEVCYDITNMGVILLVLGAMLLLWAHIVWLVVLLLSMWRFQKLQLVPADSQAQLSPGPSASLPSSGDAHPLGKGAAENAAEGPIVEDV
jgi:hypothetical protein